MMLLSSPAPNGARRCCPAHPSHDSGRISSRAAARQAPRSKEGTPERRSAPAGYQAWLARLTGLLRRHWLVALLLAAGLVLRVLAIGAYQPALIYVDTLKYLYGASPGSEPLGYTVQPAAILVAGDLATVVVVQHCSAWPWPSALYAVLLRRGMHRWLAALAVAPVLLDAYQLQMEQTIMPDVWFEALVVAGLVVLLWRPVVTAAASPPRPGCSSARRRPCKQLGEVLVVPAALYLLAAAGRWRRALTRAGAWWWCSLRADPRYCGGLLASTAISGWPAAARHRPAGGRGRLRHAAAARRPRGRCARPRREQAMGPDWLEHSGQSPLRQRRPAADQAGAGDRGAERGRHGPAAAAGRRRGRPATRCGCSR